MHDSGLGKDTPFHHFQGGFSIPFILSRPEQRAAASLKRQQTSSKHRAAAKSAGAISSIDENFTRKPAFLARTPCQLKPLEVQTRLLALKICPTQRFDGSAQVDDLRQLQLLTHGKLEARAKEADIDLHNIVRARNRELKAQSLLSKGSLC